MKAAKLLKYELAPGREDLLALMRGGRSRAELRDAGHGLGA